MSTQRARSTVAAEDRSAHPGIPGVPGWGAILIAVAATFAGFAIDAGTGHRELTFLFAALYFLGCVGAVLAVRQSAVFTAVVQPPLILFVAVPTAYFLFHRAEIDGVKDILINCGYPLIERFLLMFTTSVVVLLIGMARWYFGAANRAGKATPRAAALGAGVVAGLAAKATALLNRRSTADQDADEAEEPTPRRRTRNNTAERSAPPRERERRSSRQRETPSRRRTPRPRADDAPPPRRRYPNDADDLAGPPPPRRRTPRESGNRSVPPRVPGPREWEAEPQSRPRRPSRYQRAYQPPYEPYEPYEPYPPRESSPPSTHNPFSNVRYRGTEDDDDSGYRRPRRG